MFRESEVLKYAKEIEQHASKMYQHVHSWLNRGFDLVEILSLHLSLEEKFFALIVRRNQRVHQELQELALAVDALVPWSKIDVVYRTLRKAISYEHGIFMDDAVIGYFASMDDVSDRYLQGGTNRMHIVAWEAQNLAKGKRFKSLFKENAGRQTLAQEIVSSFIDKSALPALAGDPENAFGNNLLSAIIFILMLLYEVVLRLTGQGLLREALYLKKLVLSSSQALNDRQKDFPSVLYDCAPLAGSPPKLLTQSAFFLRHGDERENLVSIHGGYAFGAQRYHYFLQMCVGPGVFSVRYGQDCTSVVGSLLSLPYHLFDTQDVFVIRILCVDWHKKHCGGSDRVSERIDVSPELRSAILCLLRVIAQESREALHDALSVFPEFTQWLQVQIGVLTHEASLAEERQYWNALRLLVRPCVCRQLIERCTSLMLEASLAASEALLANRNAVLSIVQVKPLAGSTVPRRSGGHIGIASFLVSEGLIYLSLLRAMENRRNAGKRYVPSRDYVLGAVGFCYDIVSFSQISPGEKWVWLMEMSGNKVLT